MNDAETVTNPTLHSSAKFYPGDQRQHPARGPIIGE
jgi:hypothetical protein